MAITAGLDHARGDATVMIDGDLQDPPELIPELLEAGARRRLVVAVAPRPPGRDALQARHRALVLRADGAAGAGRPRAERGRLPPPRPRALDALLALRERSRFLRGMTAGSASRRCRSTTTATPAHAGGTKFPLKRMLRFAVDGISSFSNFPLQVADVRSASLRRARVPRPAARVVARYTGIYERGVPSLLFVVLLLGGIQLIALGLIGEYLGRIYDEVKHRPLYVVRAREPRPRGGSRALAGLERPRAP